MAFLLLPVIGINNMVEGKSLTENPFALDLCVERFQEVLRKTTEPSSTCTIPALVLAKCCGLAYIRLYKAGLSFVGFNGGAGFAIVKLMKPDGSYDRSPPASIALGGVGMGMLVGGEVVDSIVIFNSPSAIEAIRGTRIMKLGVNLSCAAGPNGRDATADAGVSKNSQLVATYSYSFSKGLFFGGSLEGSYFKTREEENARYYNHVVTTQELLSGTCKHVPYAARNAEREVEMAIRGVGAYGTQSLGGRQVLRSALSVAPPPPPPRVPSLAVAPPPAPPRTVAPVARALAPPPPPRYRKEKEDEFSL